MFEFTLVDNFQQIQCINAPSQNDFIILKNYFRRRKNDSYMDPAVKFGYQDGFASFFNDVYLPIGLWGELHNYLYSRGYPTIIHGLKEFLNFDINRDEIIASIYEIFDGTTIKPRWYQLESIYNIIKYRYSAQQLSTASGKTMISYATAAYLKKNGQIHSNKKFMMIVPKAGLVEQTYSKFTSVYDNGTVPLKCMRIGGGHKFNAKEYVDSDVVITTFQSLNNLNDSIFKTVGTINVDEAHTAKTDSIVRAIKLSTPLRYRFGFSGTLTDDMEMANYFENLKQLGPLAMVYDPKDLIEDGFAPEVNIQSITLDYGDRKEEEIISAYLNYRENSKPPKDSLEELQFWKDLYKVERDILLADEIRLQSILKFLKTLKGNTLILFNDVKGEYGKKIHENLVQSGIYSQYIDGEVKTKSRDIYSDEMEKRNDMMLVASFGTFSTGIDLCNIFNIVMVESFKSPILIGQTIGRGLRFLEGKNVINVIEFIDSIFKHTVKQAKGREVIYKKQNYPIKRMTIKL